MEREALEKWLNVMIDAHRLIWENQDFVYDDEAYTGISYDRLPNAIYILGIVRVAEILGCCIKFIPTLFGTKASIMYRGVEFIEWKY